MERLRFFFITSIVLFVCAGTALSAQTKRISLSYTGGSGYTLVERTDLRRYVNGKYVGLTNREVRSFISPALSPREDFNNSTNPLSRGQWYDGSFYVLEETKRSGIRNAGGIHDSISSVFNISPEGKLTMYQDNGYPSFRSFPAFTKNQIAVGDSWRATAERAVDPLNKGIFTRLNMEVGYTYVGEDVYKDLPVYRIKAMWQTSYGMVSYRDPHGDEALIKAQGGHKADIIVLQSTGAAIMIIDTVDETFIYNDGTNVNFKGTINLFTEFPPALNTERLIPALQRIASVSPDVTKSTASVASAKPSPATAKPKSTTTADAGGTSGKTTASTGANGTNSAGTAADSNGGGKGKDKQKAVASIKGEQGAAKQDATAKKAGSSKARRASTDAPKATNNDSAENKAKNNSTPAGGNAGSAATSGDSSPGGGTAVLASIKAATEETPKNNIVVEKTTAGIRLSVRDIKFKADSDEILPGESARLDEIASVLKLAPDSQFLVEGHTASVGNPKGEQTLSVQRAHRIAQELEMRGINTQTFICRGWGGTKPIASNATPEGKAKNRRVEITILQ